jgi:hypothetical protein
MHKSRIIISVKPKIVINSQDVYFGITRQCAQVELKNINIISKKKSSRQFLFTRQFLQHPLHKFVQFLAQQLVTT